MTACSWDGQRVSLSRVSCAYERTEARDKGKFVVCEVGHTLVHQGDLLRSEGLSLRKYFFPFFFSFLPGRNDIYSLLLVHPLWSGTLTAFPESGEGRQDEEG